MDETNDHGYTRPELDDDLAHAGDDYRDEQKVTR